MRRSIYRITLLVISLWPLKAEAGQLKLLPETVTLTGPQASQRLIVLAEEGGQYIGDRTGQATFASSNSAVASVNEAGFVKAVTDGEAVITANVEGQQATAKIKVEKTQEPVDWSFRNDVIPMMTKIGCNSGACHGALAGKGGFKLSLRGYAPEVDHFVMTRQALGRRVDRLEPSRSLMLMKPALAVAHGGGLKLEVDSPEFRLLADWIATGAHLTSPLRKQG